MPVLVLRASPRSNALAERRVRGRKRGGAHRRLERVADASAVRLVGLHARVGERRDGQNRRDEHRHDHRLQLHVLNPPIGFPWVT